MSVDETAEAILDKSVGVVTFTNGKVYGGEPTITETGLQGIPYQMCEPTFDVIKGADGINRPYPKAVIDIYRKYAGMNFGRAENTREICGND